MTYFRKLAEVGRSGKKLNGWIISSIELSINLLEATKYIKDQLKRAGSGKKFDDVILIWDIGQLIVSEALKYYSTSKEKHESG
jgi:hypothetical protein